MSKFLVKESAENEPSGTPEKDAADDDAYKKLQQSIKMSEEWWLHYVRIGFLVLTVVVTAIIVLIYLWHLVAKHEWLWLSPENLSSLEKLAITIITGLILSLSTSYFLRKIFDTFYSVRWPLD